MPVDAAVAVMPVEIDALGVMKELIELGVITHEMSSFVSHNPDAVTMRGGYVSAAPPLELLLRSSIKGPKLVAEDSSITNHIILNANVEPFTGPIAPEIDLFSGQHSKNVYIFFYFAKVVQIKLIPYHLLYRISHLFSFYWLQNCLARKPSLKHY